MPLDSTHTQLTVATTDAADRKRRRLRLALMIAGPGVALLAGLAWYLLGGGVATDNSYVQADMGPFSADVSGTIIAVDVTENQHVRKGDPLFRIDDRSYRVALDRADAQLGTARDQVAALKANYRQAAEAIRLASIDQSYARTQFD